MGGAMSFIVPGIFVGGLSAARSDEQLTENGITHLCSIVQQTIESPTRKQIIFRVGDSPEEELARYFEDACLFIHDARMSGGSVLVHCACGVSRSVTITLAYLLVVTDFSLAELFKAVQGARNCACPNYGFMQQLLDFERTNRAALLRAQLIARYGDFPSERKQSDQSFLQAALERQEYFIIHGVYPDEKSLDQPIAAKPTEGASNQFDGTSKTLTQAETDKVRSLNSTFYTVYSHGKPREIGEYLANRKAPVEDEKVLNQSNSSD